MKRIGIIAGSFDPVTNGHIDLISRAALLFDKLIVAIGSNPAKKTLFSVEERLDLIFRELQNVKPAVALDSFTGLLVDYARLHNAKFLVRGIRSASDLEYETNLANINRSIEPEIETIFLPTKPELACISSSAVKELARFNAPIYNMVSGYVADAVYKKLGAGE